MTEPTQMTRSPSYALATDEGEALWFLGGLMVIKAGGEQTGNAFSLVDSVVPQGPGSPLHVQPGEDETFYVLEGEVTFHLDGREVKASAGSTVFIGRGTPHAYHVDSETARLLVLDTPAGHERFFRALAEPAAERTLPPPVEGPPEMERMALAAREAGFQILGPPPF